MFYLKDSSYQLLGELSIKLIGSTELTNSVRENLWDFQLNIKVAQQSGEDQPSLDQVEILNVSCEEERKLSLNILLEEVLVADAAEEITVQSTLYKCTLYKCTPFISALFYLIPS